MKESSRRLFFALWPTAKQQASLAKATRQVLQASGGRAVPESNLHVTLAFLGSVPERRLGELTAIAQRVSSSFGTAHPLQVSFDRLEYWKKAQVLCAVPGARAASHALAELAAALKTELMAAAFAPELKPFRAHVTLARKVSRRSDWPHELRAHPVPWSFTGFSLMESRTDASGALYSRVESWLLAKRISTEKA